MSNILTRILRTHSGSKRGSGCLSDRRVRLSLEELEDRISPVGYVVDVFTDTGAGNNNEGDLRYCINQLDQNGGASNTIVFQTGVKKLSGTIELQSELPAILKNVSINGPGSSVLTVLGNGNAANPYRIFDISTGVIATIQGLTIEGGYVFGDSGGGIYNGGRLTLNGDLIALNQAVANGVGAGGNGGGIWNGLGNSLTLASTDVASNTASGYGGGIMNQGTVLGQGTSIYANNAANGGGLYNLQNVKNVNANIFLQRDSEVYSNSASGDGGGIYVNGGEVTMSGFSGGYISKNDATNGGGVYVLTGTLSLSLGLSVTSNQASNNGGGIYLADKGGNNPAATATLNNVTIDGNTAGNQAPGIAEQGNATCNETNVTDDDDPGGKPVKVL